MSKTRPEGHEIDSSDEWKAGDEDRRAGHDRRQPISAPLVDTPSAQRRTASMSFVVALSVIFGVIIAGGTILGVMGKAFYVSREEYTEKNLRNAEEQTTIKQTLDRVDRSMSRQEAAFEKLSDAVQTIKVDMARRAEPTVVRR